MKVHPKNNRGFTLIELLVVISIISLLSSVIFVSLNSVRQKARNALRLETIHTFVNAFNLGLNDSNSFPIANSTWACITATCYGGWSSYIDNSTVTAFLASSLPNKPSDPSDSIRGYGGFLYFNPATFFGVTGAWINYLMEPGGSCGPGQLYSTTSNYVQCLINL